MSTIKEAIERLEMAVERQSSFGVGTSRSVTTASVGVRCLSEEGEWSTNTDLPRALGGSASAPTPGALVRAALGSCMAMSYQLRAARHGIELSAVRVTVETDSHLVGMLSCDVDVPPGYTAVRYQVEIESPAAAGDVERVVDEADQLSPILDVFARRNDLTRTVSITQVGG